MKLRELVAMTDLRLDVVAARPGLDAVVTGAFTTDLPTPGRYLDGGELVLSSLMFRRGPTDSEAFVRHLVEHRVSGLAAGTANGPVPADVVEACERHALPLLVVVPEVSFGTIIERILFSQVAATGGSAERSAARWRRMVSTVAAGEGVGRLLSEAAADIGHAGTVLTAAGRLVAGAPIDPGLVPNLVQAYLTTPRLPHTPRSEPRFTIFGIGSPARRIAGSFLVVPAAESDLRPHQRDSVADLAEALSFDRSRREDVFRVERRLADRLLNLLDSGRSPAGELDLAMRSGGLPVDSTVVAVSARRIEAQPRNGNRPPTVDHDLTRAVLEEIMLAAVPAPVVAAGTDDVVALAPASPADLPELIATIRTAAAGLIPGLARERLVLGISGAGDAPAGLRGLVQEARQARQVAERPGTPVTVRTRDDVDSHELLLANLPDAVRESYRQRLLGPLLRYDAEHRSDLVHTLEAFLRHSGSWSAAARELHVHVNTLRYRISRVEQLTGRDLTRLEHQVDLFLALRARG